MDDFFSQAVVAEPLSDQMPVENIRMNTAEGFSQNLNGSFISDADDFSEFKEFEVEPEF